MVEKLKIILQQSPMIRGITWSTIGFSSLAVCGVIINIVITLAYDPTSLGVFNFSFMIYILLSQIASFSINHSTMRYSALYQSDKVALGKILGSGAFIGLFFGIFIACVCQWLTYRFKIYFRNESTYLALMNSFYGLMLFPLNKILQAHLNGLRKMKMFAIIQSLRYLIVTLVVLYMSWLSSPIGYFTFSFFISEFILTLLLWAYIRRCLTTNPWAFDFFWIRKHFMFGAHAFWYGILTELNTKLDVIFVGILLNERSVGIYSFSVMLVNGLYALLIMVRTNFNPTLVSIIKDNQWPKAQTLLHRSKQYVFSLTSVFSLVIFFLFCVFSLCFYPEKELQEGIVPLMILLSGLTMISFLLPFDNLMMVAGYPGQQSIQLITTTLLITTTTPILIRHFGLTGAALGTVSGYFLSAILLIVLTRYYMGWNLLTGKKTSIDLAH